MKAAAGELNPRASSPKLKAARGVEEGCDEVLIPCEWPCKDAGVFTAGDLCEKGRPITCVGLGEGVTCVGVPRVFLGVEWD